MHINSIKRMSVFSRYSFGYQKIANMHNQSRNQTHHDCTWSYKFLLPSNLDPEMKLSFSLISLRHFPYCECWSCTGIRYNCWSLIHMCIIFIEQLILNMQTFSSYLKLLIRSFRLFYLNNVKTYRFRRKKGTRLFFCIFIIHNSDKCTKMFVWNNFLWKPGIKKVCNMSRKLIFIVQHDSSN